MCPACGSHCSQVPAAPLPWRPSTAWPLQCPSSWKTAEKHYVSGAMTLLKRSTAPCPRGGARRHQQVGHILCISRTPSDRSSRTTWQSLAGEDRILLSWAPLPQKARCLIQRSADKKITLLYKEKNRHYWCSAAAAHRPWLPPTALISYA